MGARKPGQQNMAVSAALNIVRKACMVAFPLITYSYATRILGRAGIGIHEFAQSIVSYFALIAALGITQYAVRDGGALLREHYADRESKGDAHRTRLDDFASEVFSINMCMTVISYIIMGICIAVVPPLKGYGVAIWIASSLILFTTIGVDWINSLFEDYLYLTIRYIIVSVIALILLFVLVKDPSDVYYYIFIANFATIANAIMNIFYIRRHVKLRFTFSLNLAVHALPIFTLFCNNISSVIYLNSDVTILGILKDDETVGLYGMSAKVYMMIKDIVNAAIFVTIPRFSMYVAEGKENASKKYIDGLRNLISPLLTFLVPACVGLFMMAQYVIFMIAGEKFIEATQSLNILSAAMFFAVMACFLAYAIVLPNKKEKYFLMATTAAAIVNIILNLVMIPMIGLNAAAITTLIAEIMVFTILLLVSNNSVPIKSILKKNDVISVIVGSVAVGIICVIATMLALRIYGDSGLVTGRLEIFDMPSMSVISCILFSVVTIAVSLVAYAAVLVIFKNSVVVLVKSKLKKS